MDVRQLRVSHRGLDLSSAVIEKGEVNVAAKATIKILEALVTPLVWVADSIKFAARILRIEPFFVTSSILVSLLVAFEVVDIVTGEDSSVLGIGILALGCSWLIFVAWMSIAAFVHPGKQRTDPSDDLDDDGIR